MKYMIHFTSLRKMQLISTRKVEQYWYKQVKITIKYKIMYVSIRKMLTFLASLTPRIRTAIKINRNMEIISFPLLCRL